MSVLEFLEGLREAIHYSDGEYGEVMVHIPSLDDAIETLRRVGRWVPPPSKEAEHGK